MIDEVLYTKHQNAITTSQHTEISVQYAIEALQDLIIKPEKGEGFRDAEVVHNNILKRKIDYLEALLK